MRVNDSTSFSRRHFLKQGAALAIGFSFSGLAVARVLGEITEADATPVAKAKSVDGTRVDAFLVLEGDGTLTLYTGKVNLGTGNTTALAQMAAEELEFPIGRVRVVQGDTAMTVDQGATIGSLSISNAGIQLRQAAATAAAAIREVAARAYRIAPTEVRLENGAAFRGAADKQGTPYHRLLGAHPLALNLDPKAPLKSTGNYKLVGKPVKRDDVRAKVFADFTFMHDVKVDGMVHARVVHPNAYGAQLVSVDDTHAKKVPGFLRTVRVGNLLAAIASDEWAAIQSARALEVTWSSWSGLPEQSKLYDAVRVLPLHDQGKVLERGHASDTISKASQGKTVRATYAWPFQTHGSIGPSCAIGDYRDGKLTVWSATQSPHLTRDQIARMLKMDKGDVRLIYVEGAGCYGRNGHEDAAAEAALLSKAIGRPVRVQWMREDEHGWDPKGPPVISDMVGAVDDEGRIQAWQYTSWVPYRASGSVDVPLLAGELVRASTLADVPDNPGGMEFNMVSPYAIPNVNVVVNRYARSPLRPAWLRGPGRLQHTYANESFMDELAAAAHADPIAFRLRHLSEPRLKAVVEALEKRSGWVRRPSFSTRPGGNIARGRGMACVRYEPNNAYVAAVIEIELDRTTGVIQVGKVTVVHDCGLVVNPDGVRNQVEGEVVQTISRTLFEEVNFSASAVTSVDWLTYRLLKFPELPSQVDVVLLDRPDEPPVGAGEPACAVIPSAIASAVYDAVGIRPRTLPFSPASIRELLKS
ncbi:xanthine dehydrogenase family protein molybdopterin-binding subunit [Ralstonia soli]|uniref:Molybdopterin-dependent oxidoreductase n=1 Tax=Ralstonia soli TaxID=2953896 RepID=A0ABT1ANU4_9RALS|nr:molybdopterin cofactor-binding domain-containing protein [Ralstonia soli]MCO5400065.1 molybdopterin-dependent oxidoreductase [Ralstonia soli]